MALEQALAAYVLSLERCLASTHRAEDRSTYEKYLADAAGILASCVAGQSANLNSRIEAHERLWGHTWLTDEVYREAASAWRMVKNESKQIAT
jgi:hypothetical protein